MKVVTVNCLHCDAPVEVLENTRQVVCTSCSTLFQVEADDADNPAVSPVPGEKGAADWTGKVEQVEAGLLSAGGMAVAALVLLAGAFVCLLGAVFLGAVPLIVPVFYMLAFALTIGAGALFYARSLATRRSYRCPECGEAVLVEHMAAQRCSTCGAPLQRGRA